MSTLNPLLTPARTRYNCQSDSKKSVLEQISQLICRALPDVDCDDLFEAFVARERLGSTAIDHGVAIPHIRTEQLNEPIAALLHLSEGIDFGANDQGKVDLVFGLAVPENSNENHLQLLATLAKCFKQEQFRDECRTAADDLSFYTVMTQCISSND